MSVRKFCIWLGKHLNSYTIMIDGKKYLTRHYFFGKDRKWFNIYLHQFHMSDQGIELHNHPFWRSLSLILAGGYAEEKRLSNDTIVSRLVLPWTLNYINNKDFHRVDLLEEDAWSIFITGPRLQDWYFWDRNTKETKHYTSNPNAIP